MSSTLKTNCPICNKQDTWHADNAFKPFCSHRCKLIDLGEWANETRIIAGASVIDGGNFPLEQHKDSEE